MSRRPQAILQDTRNLLAMLAADLPALERQLRDMTRDGFPTSSGQPGGSSTLADPTAAAVLAHDQARADLDRLYANLIRIHHLTVTIDAIRRNYLHRPSEQEMADIRAASRCASPWCDEYAVKAGRCSACYQRERRAAVAET